MDFDAQQQLLCSSACADCVILFVGIVSFFSGFAFYFLSVRNAIFFYFM